MAKLIYSAIASLDGYIEDEEGKFDWAAPDDQRRLGNRVAHFHYGVRVSGRQR